MVHIKVVWEYVSLILDKIRKFDVGKRKERPEIDNMMVNFVSLTQTYLYLGRENLKRKKKTFLLDWPTGKSALHCVDWWLMCEGQTHNSSWQAYAIPTQMIPGCIKNASWTSHEV